MHIKNKCFTQKKQGLAVAFQRASEDSKKKECFYKIAKTARVKKAKHCFHLKVKWAFFWALTQKNVQNSHSFLGIFFQKGKGFSSHLIKGNNAGGEFFHISIILSFGR